MTDTTTTREFDGVLAMAYATLAEAKDAAIRWAKAHDTVIRVRAASAVDRAECDLGDDARWVVCTSDYENAVAGNDPLIVVGPRPDGEFRVLTNDGSFWREEGV